MIFLNNIFTLKRQLIRVYSSFLSFIDLSIQAVLAPVNDGVHDKAVSPKFVFKLSYAVFI